uniref:Ntox44 domain-containing protein n=1 Tax=Mesocestoides corti TaxID=53468 RepID=A0A5K3G2G3_MESCO
MGTKNWDALPEYQGLGRSYAIGFFKLRSPADMLFRFAHEVTNYDYETNTCWANCGNYTQVSAA